MKGRMVVYYGFLPPMLADFFHWLTSAIVLVVIFLVITGHLVWR